MNRFLHESPACALFRMKQIDHFVISRLTQNYAITSPSAIVTFLSPRGWDLDPGRCVFSESRDLVLLRAAVVWRSICLRFLHETHTHGSHVHFSQQTRSCQCPPLFSEARSFHVTHLSILVSPELGYRCGAPHLAHIFTRIMLYDLSSFWHFFHIISNITFYTLFYHFLKACLKKMKTFDLRYSVFHKIFNFLLKYLQQKKCISIHIYICLYTHIICIFYSYFF